MMIQRQHNRKLNNVGMSLVEIVVAMFILAAVTVTVLSILVYSIRLNSRSRTRQQTTAAAQTVMENFKAYSMQEIAEQFAQIGTKYFNVSGVSHADPGVADPTQIIHRTAGGAVLLDNDSLDSEAIEQLLASGDDLNFRIHDMKYQNEYYDVEVELTSHDLHGQPADMETLVYENRTAENSAVYVGYASMDAEALSGIADEIAVLWTAAEEAEHAAAATPTPAPTADPSGDPAAPPAISHSGSEVDTSQIKITKRVITVKIKKDADDNCVVEVGCTYYYGGNTYQYGISETGTPKTFPIAADTPYELDLDNARPELTKEIFRQPIVDNKIPLENLTLYYYPAYSHDTAVKIGEDRIEIIKDGIPNDYEVKCYIYKQRNPKISDNKIAKAELLPNYSLGLHLDANVNIYDDNLDIVLGDPTATYVYNYTSDPFSSPGERYYGIGYASKNGIYPNSAPGATPQPTIMNLRMMYDITISVYRQGDLPDDGSIPDPADYPATLSVLKSTIIE